MMVQVIKSTYMTRLTLKQYQSTNSVCCNQVTSVLTDILDQCSEPEWLVVDKDILKYLEFCLWESYRFGASFHCSGTSPCLWIDSDKLLTLARKALGNNLGTMTS